MNQLKNNNEKRFTIISSFLSLILSLLYVWKGISEQFIPVTCIVIGFCLLYIPVVLIFKRFGFAIFNLIYAIVLIFLIAFSETRLFNNFTGLMAIFVVIMIKPNWKYPSIGLYIIAITVAFALNNENLCHYLIHVVRGTWLFLVFDFVLAEKYERKKLILTEDERKILTELSKNRLQKSIEFEGFSESTIYRRIKAAMTRNNLSKKELLEEFKKEQTKGTE